MMQKLLWAGLTGLVTGSTIAVAEPGLAQSRIEPDETLGSERSTVIQNFRGTPNEVIGGGARRGRNVFHSLREFNVDEGRGAYFLNDGNFRNIFSRVTGGNPSQILGELGTIRIENGQIFPTRDNPANLYLINPNGIVFGPNARLNLGGSFVGTTANAVQFSDLGFFSATNPELPTPLLTVDPSTLLFNQIPSGSIINQSVAPNQGSNAFGLLVLAQRNLLLVGGDVRLDGGRLNAVGGRIELGGLAAPGTVGLQMNGDNPSLVFPTNTALANVSLTNDAQILLAGDASSSINVNANTLNATSGGGIVSVATVEGRGNITINANAINLAGIGQSGLQSSLVSATSVGNGGSIVVNTQSLDIRDRAVILGSSISSGDSGHITISTGSLNISNGGIISNLATGEGDTGNIQINASGNISIIGNGTTNNPTGVSSATVSTAGRTGNIDINADSLTVQDAGAITSAALGQAGSGDITINARNQISASNGARISSSLLPGSAGRVGNINITTDTLQLTGNSSVATTIFLGAGISDRESGEININARDTISFDNSNIFSGPLPGGSGRAGDIRISTGSLTLANSSGISASTSGNGDAGDIEIRVRGATSLTNSRILSGPFLVAGIDSNTINSNVSARGGDILIETGSLLLRGTSTIGASLFGIGQSGDVAISSTGSIELDGGSISSDTNGFDERLRFLGFDESLRSVGNAGDVTINADSMMLRNGAQISSGIGNNGQGVGGEVIITLRGALFIDGTPNGEVGAGVLTRLDPGAVGQGGNIVISASDINLVNRAQLTASTRGRGNAGNVLLNARGQISLTERSTILSNTQGQGDAGDVSVQAGGDVSLTGNSGISSTVETDAIGRGGDIDIEANSVVLTDEASLTTSTLGQGDAGNIRIVAGNRVSLSSGSTILSNTLANGDAGDITIRANGNINITSAPSRQTGISSGVNDGAIGRGGNLRIEASSLTLRNAGQLQTSTSGRGRAGNIVIDVEGPVRLSGFVTRSGNVRNIVSNNQITSAVERGGQGRAGDITLRAGSLSMDNLSSLGSDTSGRGNAGNLRIRVDNAINLNGLSSIRSGVEAGGVGDAGDIDIRARSLTLTNGAQVIAAVARPDSNNAGGRGQGGNIRINATDFVNLDGYSRNQLRIVDSSNPSITFLTTGFSSGFATDSGRNASGDAGNIFVNTNEFRVTDGGSVTATTANPNSDSGNITINARNFEASGGGQVVTTTRSRGNAGRITLNIAENTTLTGSDPNFQQRRQQVQRVLREPGQTTQVSDVITGQGAASGLFASTSAQSSGDGGSINLQTTDLNLTDRATISARSQGSGIAGDINLDVEQTLSADNSDIATTATNSSGGDINLTAEAIRLQNDSDIRTNSAVSGGNININADSLIAYDDSDIIAAARNQGGNINFNNTIAFLESYAPQAADTNPATLQGNNRADINATGATPGTISLPDISAIQNSLADLPANAIDPDALIANSCIARTESGSTFLITGTGGLPTDRPDTLPPSGYPTDTVRTEADTGWQPGDLIVEPQGVYQLPSGGLVLSHECR